MLQYLSCACWFTPNTVCGVVAATLALASVTAKEFYKVDAVAGKIMIPYLLWLVFANALNYSIWKKNPAVSPSAGHSSRVLHDCKADSPVSVSHFKQACWQTGSLISTTGLIMDACFAEVFLSLCTCLVLCRLYRHLPWESSGIQLNKSPYMKQAAITASLIGSSSKVLFRKFKTYQQSPSVWHRQVHQ